MADVISYEQLLNEFKALAKRADQRLVRLEQAGKTGTGAYRSAMRRISQFSEGKRFNIKPPKDTRALRSRISAVREFLSTETSTARGRKAVSKRTRDTIRERYGLDIKNDAQLEAIFEGGLWSKLNTRFGSDTAIQILATVQESDDSVKDAILGASDRYYVSEEGANDAEAIINSFIADKNISKIFGRK